MKKGNLKDRIAIQRYTETGRNGLNEPVMEWSTFTMSWAATYYGTGVEQRQASQTSGAQAASFEVPANPKTRSIVLTDRVSFAGGLWDIRSIAPIGRDGVKINVVRQVP